MGILNNVLGLGGLAKSLGGAIKDTSEVFHVNETAKMQAQEKRFQAAISQFEGEFARQESWFDSLISGVNRLPRPTMALGTIGLFVYAMADPVGFSERMMGLNLIPEPLWWLLGAVVGFYFGARELHHYRAKPISQLNIEKLQSPVQENVENVDESKNVNIEVKKAENITHIDTSKFAQTSKTKDNAAILEWVQKQA